MKPTIIIGHKNPDSDSICAAISYAYLKTQITGEEHVPCRAGHVNPETQYILDTFGIEKPQYIASLEPRIHDIQYRKITGISSHLSLRRAWMYMRDNNVTTLPVVNSHNQLKGIVTLGDIARFYMQDQGAAALAEAKTSYRNIVDVLNGELVVGDPEGHFTEGNVIVAAANPDVMEDYIHEHDMVILGNRYESQLCSIEMKASCIVVGLGAKVSKTIRKLAQESGCAIIATPLDTYSCSKLINQAVPVRHVMKVRNLVSFRHDDMVADVRATVSKQRIRYYPILDSAGNYMGLFSQRNLLDMERQRVILVDHNEHGQAVDGIRSADVMEIIDHHRIDAVETSNPIYFRNMPLGCTCTIVTMMFRENQVDIPKHIAGLLCSAILSDTLMFRSPTCTPTDEMTARYLAEIAGIDILEHATAMFNAGSQLGDRTPDEIFHTDYKRFTSDDKQLAVAQVTSVSQSELDRLAEEMVPYLKSQLPISGLDMLFLMLTNIIGESTNLLYVGQGAKDYVSAAFHCEAGENSVFLKGMVSRKKQLMTPLLSAMGDTE